MTPLYHARKPHGRWFVPAFALLIAGLSIVGLSIIGVPAVAQQANVSAPLSADEVMGRVDRDERTTCQSIGKLLQCSQLSPGVPLSVT